MGICLELELLSHWLYICLAVEDTVNFYEVYQFTLVPVKCESPNCSTTLSTIGIVVHLILAILETKILIFTKIL